MFLGNYLHIQCYFKYRLGYKKAHRYTFLCSLDVLLLPLKVDVVILFAGGGEELVGDGEAGGEGGLEGLVAHLRNIGGHLKAVVGGFLFELPRKALYFFSGALLCLTFRPHVCTHIKSMNLDSTTCISNQ